MKSILTAEIFIDLRDDLVGGLVDDKGKKWFTPMRK
jgi:hypothetical protein